MNTANLLGSHLNPQQTRLFTEEPSRKRWIWSPRQDHLPLLAALAGQAAAGGQKVVIWYDDAAVANRLLAQYPLQDMNPAVYAELPDWTNQAAHALHPLAPADSIHHIELYKYAEDFVRLRAPWESLHEDLWPGTTRYDLIDKFAGLFNPSSVNPLFYKLGRTAFDISPAEYKRLRNKLEHYIKLNKLHQDGFIHLEQLDIQQLIQHSLDFVKNEVMEYVSLMSHRASELLKQGDWIMLRYFNYVKTYWIRELHGFVNLIDKWLTHANELHLTYGDAFTFESSMSQLADKLRGQISRKARLISQDRKAIKDQYLELLATIEAGQPWVAIPAERKQHPSLTEAIHYLTQLRHELLHARESIETHIRSQLKRLNSHNAPDDTGLAAEIREWEEDLRKWYSDVNVSGYFRQRFESQALSLHRSMEMLRDINENLSAIVDRQHLLEDYFFWAGFQQQFPEPARMVVSALQLIPQADWLTYYDEWYITQLITGDALEVEWPSLPHADLLALHHKIRHHLLAEFQHELQHRRITLHDTHQAQLRHLKTRKTGIDPEAADAYVAGLSLQERGEWYPIQLLPVSRMPVPGSEVTQGFTEFILLDARQPDLLESWPLIQDATCDVYAAVQPLNQRFTAEMLDLPTLAPEFRLDQRRASSALKYLTQIAKQFGPFLDQTCIYAAHRVNVISMLGKDLDRLVLDKLPMPYKISEHSLCPDENYLIESLLEPNNPFVLLLRDFWPKGAWPANSLWHLQFQAELDRLGIKVIHSWSKGWLLDAGQEVRSVRDDILLHVGSTFTGLQMV